MAMTPAYATSFVHALVPSALTAYDLPDLAAASAPRRLLLADPRDGTGGAAGGPAIAADTKVIAQAYAAKVSQPQFQMLPGGEKAALNQALEAWLK